MIQYWKKSFGLLILCFTLICSVSAQETAYVADHLRSFKEGKTLFNLGTYAAAQDQFYNFLHATENFSTPEYERLRMEARFLIAQSALRVGQSNAEMLLLTFIRNYKPDPYVYNAIEEIASYYYNQREYKQAIAYYNKIDLYVLPRDKQVEIRFKIGYCNFVLKNFQQARSQFLLLKDIKGPYYYPANYYLAMTFYFTEDYEKALRSFHIAENSRRYRDVIPYYISMIYYKQERYKDLIPYAEQKLEDNSIRYRNEIELLLGQAYFKQENYKKALPLIKEHAQYSTRPDDIYQLAYSYYKNGKYKQAAKHFRQIAAQEGKKGQNANFYLADSYIKLENKADARVAFANAYRKDFDKDITEEARFNYGKISAELHYDREAVNALQGIKPSSSFYTESQKILADVFYNTRDYGHSIEIMEEMGTLSPDLKRAYQRITLYYGIQKLNNKKEENALVYFNKSLQYPLNISDKMQAIYWKAYINHADKNYSKSIDLLNTYFILSRSNNYRLPVQSSEIMARYLQGYNYFEKQNYAMATGQFEKVASLIQSDNYATTEYIETSILADALVRQGDGQFKANNYASAISRYNQALDIGDISKGYALYQKALILGLQGNVAQKILNLNRIAQNYPQSPYADDALLELGRTFQTLKKYDNAIPPLEKLVNNYKGRSNLINQALLSLGLIAYNQGDIKAALNYYKEIYKNNPDKQTAMEATAAIEEIYVQDLGNPDAYVQFMENIRGTELTSSARDSITFRAANIAFESGHYDKAISNFTNYISDFPHGIYEARAHYYRAESFAVREEYRNALSDYEYVVSLGPGTYYVDALEKAAKIAYNSTEEFVKAARYYGMLEVNAQTAEQRFNAQIGGLRAAYRSGNASKVKAMAQKVSSNPIATKNDIAIAQFYLGKIALEQKNYDQALNAFNQVTLHSNDEKAAEARYNIARIYYLRHEYDLAQNLAQKAYKNSSSYPYWIAKSLILLSDILVEQGDLFNARAALEAIIENYKESGEIQKIAQKKLKHVKDLQNIKKNQPSDDLLEMEENK